MKDKEERKLRLIESEKTEKSAGNQQKANRQTNPIAGKFLTFARNKADKFNVRDLFKK